MLWNSFRTAWLLGAVTGAVLLTNVSPALATYAHWNGSVSSDWATPANWTESQPTGSDVFIFSGTSLPTISTADSIGFLNIGPWTGSPTGSSLTVASGANLAIGSHVIVGSAGAGSVTQNGGAVNLSGGLYLADQATAAGSSYSISGGSLNVLASSTPRAIGVRGGATMNVSGSAVVTIDGTAGGILGLDIGGHLTGGVPIPDSSGTSTFAQSGGTVNLTGNLPCLRLGVGAATTGIYDLTGGTLNLATNVENRDGTGYLKVNGGTLNFTGNSMDVDNLEVGTKDGAAGQFTLNAGQSMFAHILRLGSGAGAGTLDVLGGTATVDDLLFAGTASKLRLGDGQVLSVLQSNYSLADGLADVAAGFVAAYASGGAIGVRTVDIGGVAYTQFAAVPEPSAIILLSSGVLGVLAYAWKKRR